MLPLRKVFLLDDSARQLDGLSKKLLDSGYMLCLCKSPQQVLERIAGQEAHLVIAAGDYEEMSTFQLAERLYENHQIPTCVIVAAPGDMTQLRLRRHPAIVGMYYQPVKDDRIMEKIEKFFETLGHNI